jgi:hypothetical protein
MKKLQNLGRSLNKDEFRKIMGGIIRPPKHIPGLIGWVLDPNGNCWCDFVNYQAMGNPLSNGAQAPTVLCGVSCPGSMCTAGSKDPCSYGGC